jgi:CHAD domain-containing protein
LARDPSSFPRIGREKIDRFRSSLKRASRRPGVKEIHDLRVSIRRLLSFLSIAGRLAGKKRRLLEAERRLSDLLSQLGGLRDAQVKIERLKEIVPTGDEATYRYALSVQGDAIGWEGRIGKLLRGLGRKRFLLPRTALAPSLPSPAALRAKAREILADAERKIASLAAAARNEEDVEALHRMRLAFKDYRYSVEALSFLFPGIRADTLERLHAFQTLLGDIHDLDVLLEEATFFRRRVLELETEAVLEPRLRRLRGRKYERLAPIIASGESLERGAFCARARPAGRRSPRPPGP